MLAKVNANEFVVLSLSYRSILRPIRYPSEQLRPLTRLGALTFQGKAERAVLPQLRTGQALFLTQHNVA